VNVRFLPHAEWAKLDGTPLEPVRAQMSPDTTEVLVVEDESGKVVGTWMLVLMPHLEAMWVDPAHQGKASVLRKLLSRMFAYLEEMKVPQVLTHASGPVVDAYLHKLGGTPIPGRAFILPVSKEF
jgi:hypothetical protein